MRTLILMRHAKAVGPEEADSDEARTLAPRGRRDAGDAGAALKAQGGAVGFSPEAALVSISARTRETAALGLGAFDIPVRFDDSLYHAAPALIWQAFISAPEQRVLIIGHNPGLSELASMLIAQAGDSSRLARDILGGFPTSSWAAFDVSGDAMRAAGPKLMGAWRPER